MTTATVGLRRLAAQRLASPTRIAADEVVRRLGALQAQDYGAAKWAVGARLPAGAATDAAIEAALAAGAIIRTHAMRFTWQLVHPEDVRWILALVAPRLRARAANRNRQLGLDDATFRSSGRALEKALAGGDHLTRAELGRVLANAGIDPAGQRLPHLLAHAELDGRICGGARRGKELTWALLDHRVRDARPPLARDEGAAELALRYFSTRGPATLGDFTWWSGLAPSEARAGLEAITSKLVVDGAGSRTTWSAGGRRTKVRSPAAWLLPAFDEYLVAYRDRGDVLAPRYARRLNAGGGMLGPCVVVDGRVAGTWRRTPARAGAALQVDLFEPVSVGEQAAIDSAARRYGAFLGLRLTQPRSRSADETYVTAVTSRRRRLLLLQR
jgi:hypothetical protein